MTTERALQIFDHLGQAREAVMVAVGKTCGEPCNAASEAASEAVCEAVLLEQLVALHNDLLDRCALIKAQAVGLGVPGVLMDANPDVRVPAPGVW